MSTPFSPQALDWLAQATHAAPDCLNITPLRGASSSSIYLIETIHLETPEQFVLRVVDNPEWLAEEPDLIEHEAAALREVQQAGFRAPHLIAHASHEVGFGVPVLLMTCLPGQMTLHPTNFQAWLDAMAHELAAIHRHPAPHFGWYYRSWVNRAALAIPPWTTVPHLWEQAITLISQPAPSYPPVFIHRDYHPLNVLWDGDRLSGVVDWINACLGPAAEDVSHCRTNLVMMFSIAAADQFLAAYCQAADAFTYHPYWDLDSLLDMCLPEPTVYPAWPELGLTHITPRFLQQQVDAYLAHILA